MIWSGMAKKEVYDLGTDIVAISETSESSITSRFHMNAAVSIASITRLKTMVKKFES
jgi:hypothetical protein